MDHPHARTTVDLLLAINAFLDGLNDDPRWPTILEKVTTAVDAGDLSAATETLHTFLRSAADAADPATTEALADSVISEATDTLVAALAGHRPQ